MNLRRLYLYLTKLLYHQLAWAYDWIAAVVSAGYWNNWVLSILPELTETRILELGHGPGHLQDALLKSGEDVVVGLDRSPQMTRQAKKRLYDKKPNLVHGDAFYLPFSDESFECVVATFPTNYINAQKTLSEIHRVLTAKGKLVVVPGARLVAPRGLFQTIAAGIFRFFGLSQDWNQAAQQWFVVPMQTAGFEVVVESRPFRSSEIFVIIGRKH